MFFSKDLTMGQMNALAQLFGDERDVLDALRGKFKIERIAPKFVITIGVVAGLKDLALANKVLRSCDTLADTTYTGIETGTWECELVNDPQIDITDDLDRLRAVTVDDEHGWESARPEHILAFAGAYPKVVKDLQGKLIYALAAPVANDDYLTVGYYGSGNSGYGPRRIQAMVFASDWGIGSDTHSLRVRRMK